MTEISRFLLVNQIQIAQPVYWFPNEWPEWADFLLVNQKQMEQPVYWFPNEWLWIDSSSD